MPGLSLTRRDVALGVFFAPWTVAAANPLQPLFDDNAADPDRRLTRLVRLLVETLGTDRAFIYMRDPRRRMVAYTHRHTVLPGWEGKFRIGVWSQEPDPSALREPLLKSAFQNDAVHFVADIETAPPGQLNRALERSYFGHRALIHAPLYRAGTFYGVLETAMRDSPRDWQSETRALIHWLQPKVADLCHAYLQSRKDHT